MNLDSIRAFCTGPHATEDVKWANDLCFLIGGKMFAVACLDMTVQHRLAFKCTPEKFAELVELVGIIPAPYMARNNWVSMQKFGALRDAEIESLVRESYEMVLAKLPKRVQAELGGVSANQGGAKKVATKKKRGG
jgi:predicted DNA-binding protein (MmcQ/YjbR family)